MMLMQLIITETVAKSLTLAAKSLIGVLKRVILRTKKWKSKFSESEEIVWVLYYQSALWFSTIFFPYLAIL